MHKSAMKCAFSNHRLFSAFFIICLFALPKSSLSDDDHNWNASATFSKSYDGSVRIVMAHLTWDEPPRPRGATSLAYRISHYAGGGNIVSWGNTSGFLRAWQGWVSAADFEVIYQEMISQVQVFTIELEYYDGDWNSISHTFAWEPPPFEATEPDPTDGTVVVLPSDSPLQLKWRPGKDQPTHDVYFGDYFRDVNEGKQDTFLGNLPGFPTIGTSESDFITDLLPGKTYYWRVDEVDAEGTKYRGDVWSFWVKPPVPITDPNLVCLWTFDLHEGDHVIDWSGHDNDGTVEGGSQLVEGYDGLALSSATEGDFVACSLDQAATWLAGTVAFWVRADSVGQNAWSGLFASHLSSSAGFQIDTDGGNPGTYQVSPGGLIFGAVATEWSHLALTFDGAIANLYYNGSLTRSGTLRNTKFNQFALGTNRNMANSFFGIFDDLQIYDYALTQDQLKQAMRINPLAAWDPVPADGSLPNAESATPLMWTPGEGASRHDVYFSTDHGSVAAADASDTSGVYRGRQNLAAYTPTEGLRSGETYYWRIDEADSMNGNTPSKGDIWSFTIRPETACRPHPSDGSRLRERSVALSWTAGRAGVLHEVYFGANLDQVRNADASDASGIYRGQRDVTIYTPDQLEWGQTYYWRVDEVRSDGTVLHRGSVWSFAVANVETVEYKVSSGQDDGYANEEGSHNTGYAYLRVGRSSYAGSPYYTSGIVFRNVSVPRGSEIVSAHLKVRSYNSRLTATVYGEIEAETTDDAATFSNTHRVGSLPTTSAAVNWDIEEPWSEDTWYVSPDVASVVQEIVIRSGWSEGNSLAMIYSTRLDEGGYRNISSFDRGGDYAPILKITYIPQQ